MSQNETTPTPGPWEVAYLDHNGQRVVKGEHIEIATCWHHSVGAIEKEMEANAHMIAAAPDLLAALKWFIDDIDGTHTVMVEFDENVERARAAIAKALGKSR